MLTDVAIRKLTVPAKQKKIADERGLFLLLTPSGGRLWRLKYRFGSKEKLLALGSYPEISLAKARELREEARRHIAHGTDPSAARREEKWQQGLAASNDFEGVAREWLENIRPRWKNITYSDTKKRFEKYVFPVLGRRPMADVSPPEILSLLRKIEARGIVFTAHKIARSCGQVFRYGIVTGRCERDPRRRCSVIGAPQPRLGLQGSRQFG